MATKAEMLSAVASNLASRNLSGDQIEAIAEALGRSKHPVLGMDVCTHGICIDFDVKEGLGGFDIKDFLDVSAGRIGGIEIFPTGIISPIGARVRLTQKL